MFNKVFPREKYLERIRPFYHSDIIKVITGIRRCGKSFLLKAIMNELEEAGIQEEQILYLPLDRRGFKSIQNAEQLEERIESMIHKDGFHYLIIDEVQNVSGFEKIVQAYMEEGFSVFLTGSNSYLLSDEITTKLTGRFLTFETFPLDFKEYLAMKAYFGMETQMSIEDSFQEYILEGGFPKALEFADKGARQLYTKEIIREIFEKDVKTRKHISNIAVYERVQAFLLNNYAAPFSITNLHEVLKKEGFATKATTIRNYVEDLKKAKIIYECNRFDMKSKKAIHRDQKYYLADMSIFFAMNTDNNISFGPTLENLVYLYLISNNYEVSIGRIGNWECDFVVRDKERNYAYIQVTYTLQGSDKEATEKLKEREYRPFRKIPDSYPRYIISLDRFRDQQEGVKHLNAIDLLLGKTIL